MEPDGSSLTGLPHHAGDSRSKPKTASFANGGFGFNYSGAGLSEALATTWLQRNQLRVNSQGSVVLHNSFPFLQLYGNSYSEEARGPIFSGVRSTTNITDKSTSCYASDENTKMGTLSLPFKNESAEGENSSGKSSKKSNMSTSLKDTPEHFPRVKNILKRKNLAVADAENKVAENSKKKAARHPGRKHGASGDPRMNRAVQAKIEDPNLSFVEALVRGGFIFNHIENSPGMSLGAVRDADNITLYQRRNQLMRRLRYIKGKASKTVDPKDSEGTPL